MTINDAVIILCEDCVWYDRCITPCDKFVKAVMEKDEEKDGGDS